MMAELPADSAALIACGRRFRLAPAKISSSVLPRTSGSACPDATSIHRFQPTTRPAASTTTTPPSIASTTALKSIASLAGIGRGGGRGSSHAGDVARQQLLQRDQRRQVEQHREVSLDIAPAHREVDVDEQHAVVDLRPGGQVEEFGAIAMHDFRQRNPQSTPEAVGNRAEAAVQQDIARFRQRFLLEFDQILQGKVAAHHGTHQLHALRLGEYQQRAPADVAVEILVYRDETLGRVAAEIRDGLLACHDGDVRYRQKDFLLHHFPQAYRGIAHAEIDEFRQRIQLQLSEHDGRLVGHHRASCRGAAASPRNARKATAVRGLGRNAAPAARARSTTSAWWFAEITATRIPGFSSRTSAARTSPSMPGMLKSSRAMSGASRCTRASAVAASDASNLVQSGCRESSALMTAMRASLLSSTISTFRVTRFSSAFRFELGQSSGMLAEHQTGSFTARRHVGVQPSCERGASRGSQHGWRGGQQHLDDCRMCGSAGTPVDHRSGRGQQQLQQLLCFLMGAFALQQDLPAGGERDAHCSSSATSSTSSTRPSPSSVVPLMPGIPASSPSSGFRMMSRRSPSASTSSPQRCPAKAAMTMVASPVSCRLPVSPSICPRSNTGMVWSRTTTARAAPTAASELRGTRMVSTTVSSGTPNICPPASTLITVVIITLNGSMNRTVVPRPASEWIDTRPPIRATAVRTASIPTPRPESAVTSAAVENPGAKTRSVICASLRAASTSGAATPRSAATARTRWTSTPPPSSVISIMT